MWEVNLSRAPCDMRDLQLFLKTEVGKLLWFLEIPIVARKLK